MNLDLLQLLALFHPVNFSLMASYFYYSDGVLCAYAQVNNTINPSPFNKECYLYAVDSQASIVFVSIQYAVPPECATVWTKAVFQAIQPSRCISVPYTIFLQLGINVLYSSYTIAWRWELQGWQMFVINLGTIILLLLRFTFLIQMYLQKLMQVNCNLVSGC